MESQYADNKDYQVLKKFAQNSGRTLSFSERMYEEHFITSRAPKYRTEVYIPNIKQTSYYVSLYDTYYRAGEETQFSGTFIPVSTSQEFHFIVRKRNSIDKIKGVFGDKSYKTKNSHFDSKVVITGNDESTMTKFLCNSSIQKVILKGFELRQTMIFSLNRVKLDYVDGLKGQAILGIHDRQWFMEGKEIEQMFELAEQLKENVQ
jgi:hypothetical protein